MSRYGLANAVVDLMDGDVLKGDEYTKVILAPVPCDAHIGILDVLEESGLADCNYLKGYDLAELMILPFSGKINLDDSNILKKLKEHA